MPKSKKPKKKYRPLAYKINPLAMLADHSREPINMEVLMELRIAVLSAVESIAKGNATENDLENLAAASNVAMVLCEHGLGEDHLPDVKAAQQVILGLQKRANAGESLVTTGPGLESLRVLCNLYDTQMTEGGVKFNDMRAALRIISQRIQAGNFEVSK
jgi:hypothetical protein